MGDGDEIMNMEVGRRLKRRELVKKMWLFDGTGKVTMMVVARRLREWFKG